MKKITLLLLSFCFIMACSEDSELPLKEELTKEGIPPEEEEGAPLLVTKIIEESSPYPTIEEATIDITLFVYNKDYTIKEIINPLSTTFNTIPLFNNANKITFDYENGLISKIRINDSPWPIATFEYNGNQQLVLATHENGTTTAFSYDNEIITVTESEYPDYTRTLVMDSNDYIIGEYFEGDEVLLTPSMDNNYIGGFVGFDNKNNYNNLIYPKHLAPYFRLTPNNPTGTAPFGVISYEYNSLEYPISGDISWSDGAPSVNATYIYNQ